MAETVKQQNGQIVSFIPEVTVSLSRGGLVQITVTNIRKYWENNPPKCDFEHRLAVLFGVNFADSEHFTNIREIEIESGRIPPVNDYAMHLQAPRFLRPYRLGLSFSAFNTQTEQCMERGETHVVDVPSIWTLNDNQLQIGAEIEFKTESESTTESARIMEVLPDNKYKLLHNDKEIICDASRMYEILPGKRSTVNLIGDKEDIIKTLLIRRFDELCISAYNQIIDGLQCNRDLMTKSFIFMCRFDRHPLVSFWPICHLMAYNIIGYLFEPQFNHSVHCLMDINHPKPLKLVNEWHYHHELQIELQSKGFLFEPDLPMSCDSCTLPFSQWDFFFVDQDTNIEEAHQYCCHCILNVIKLNRIVKNTLCDVLSEQLNADCIDEIVQCLIGKVIYSECNTLQKSGNSKEIKKRVVGNVACYKPNAKKRKLNQTS